MKYIINLDIEDYRRLYTGDHLKQISNTTYGYIYTTEYKHKATGVIIRIQETMEELDFLYAETDSKTAMDDFKDQLTIVRIN
tara:strand:+ start:6231 stop:6476 length:246 start_codon:yes stop_codon:yes gene_type:complete